MKTKLLVQLRKEAASRFKLKKYDACNEAHLWSYSPFLDKWKLVNSYNTSIQTTEEIKQDIKEIVQQMFYELAEDSINEKKNKIPYPW